MSAPLHPEHSVERLCDAGVAVYERALLEGRVRVQEAEGTPCLLDFGLLQRAVEDSRWLEPIAPALALRRLLRGSEERIVDERRREERLVEMFQPLMQIDEGHTAEAVTPTLRVISGKERINRAITAVMADASRESLTIQPRMALTGAPLEAAYALARARDQKLLDRGGRIRTLYQHTLRHIPIIVAHHERLHGDIEARALDEVTNRLIVIDRSVAFIPADAEGTLALEIRHPAIVGYMATTFDRLWRLATPVFPEAAPQPPHDGITPRQHAIAALLVEGHTDAVIADRLGMNIRTARVHIAKLAATLGSQSRAQLGFLIGRSGILDQER
ncbi:helix-turn-helix transcriptional regulator [Streptomyces tibetensis]|uniref:helix-turn-helix transcriptional regulator n=1 Tax=Streptomyces tibetensis TaxID=2382123 RepID=UPI00340CC5EE